MYHFRIQLQPQPASCVGGDPVLMDGLLWATLRISPSHGRSGAPTFDSAMLALEKLPRMYLEPDGSFLWSGGDSPRWQVDGNLFDRGDEIAYVDLTGACPAEQFDELLCCFGWPKVGMVFQLTHEGVFVDEATFRALAVRPAK